MLTEGQLPELLRFSDLKRLGYVNSHSALRDLQSREGFPRGLMLSPNVRVWRADEIAAWLATRSSESELVRRRAQRSIEARNGRAA
jgi:predicted DNA-binding transcriptional regulator AlpA